ncbi:high affinity glucose transporter [Collariella sp. IMI 366227]|nr:high affinity glucose transporter [Collariella sp. IMI 366227]
MMPKIHNIYFIACIAVIGGALFGFDISSMSAIITTQPYLCHFNQRGIDDNGLCLGPTDKVQGLITAAMPGGSWLGALLSGFVSDRFGRNRSIQVGIVGSIIVAAAVNIPMLAIGRTVNGFSVGICSAQVPVFISELAAPTMRGRLVSMQQWAITWGIMIMFFICYGCSRFTNSAAFRIPWALQIVPAALLLAGLQFLPESPRWLAKKGRDTEARKVLADVHASGDATSPFVLHEWSDIQRVLEVESQPFKYVELFNRQNLNRTHVGVFTQIWSQLTGMNVMMYYIGYVFSMAGLGGGDNLLSCSSIGFVINVAMTVPALLWMDKWGRRPTLLAGSALMCIWLSINAGLFAVYSRPARPGEFTSTAESMEISGNPAKAVIASTYLFVASFASTWGPVSWTYPSELYPLRIRGKAVALATSANWAFNFALAFFVPPAFAQITWMVYLVFAVFCAAMHVHVFLLFPETANKTLEEVEVLFDDKQPGAYPWIGTLAMRTKNNRHSALGAKSQPADSENQIQPVTSGGEVEDIGSENQAQPEQAGQPVMPLMPELKIETSSEEVRSSDSNSTPPGAEVTGVARQT